MCRARNNRIRPLGGLYPPGLPGYDPHLPGAQHYDPARAREEMALAGYPNGLPDEQELWLTEGDAGLYYGQLVQADLARIGIRIRLRQASFAVFLETTQRRGAVGLSMSAWSQDFPDPSNFIDTLFHSRSIQSENSQNASFYSNPQLDQLLDRARVEANHDRRIGMYQEAERMLLNDAPWAFLYYPIKTQVTQPYVRGLVPSPVWAHDLREVWLDLPRQRFARRESALRSDWASFASSATPWRIP
jgi:ABC-type transport system substrate-binding protein